MLSRREAIVGTVAGVASSLLPPKAEATKNGNTFSSKFAIGEEVWSSRYTLGRLGSLGSLTEKVVILNVTFCRLETYYQVNPNLNRDSGFGYQVREGLLRST